MKKIAIFLTAVFILFYSLSSVAVSVDFTASFTPSLSNPDNNTFTNTTPPGGYCLTFPQQCSDNKTFSVAVGLVAKLQTAGVYANAAPRDSVYFGMPGAWREFTVTNSVNGSQQSLKFRIKSFSARYHFPESLGKGNWKGGNFVYAASPCTYSGVALNANNFYQFMWKLPASPRDVECSKIALSDYLGGPTLIDTFSVGYEIQTPNPLKMESGEYIGTLNMSAGPGGDFDFGDNFSLNDSNVQFNFKLLVNHELKVDMSQDNQNILLQPCAPGKVCTQDMGDANWERWMTTRITPTITGRSDFALSSSGAFKVYLQCEYKSGDDCALKSDKNPSQLVPFKTSLTLPDNVVDFNTDSLIKNRHMKDGKSDDDIFLTKRFGQNLKGSFDYLIGQRDVDVMLSSRPDAYRGSVTVIFDPNLF